MAEIDTGIYNQLMRQPRSAMEYASDYAAQDDRAMSRQMNALQLSQAKQGAADESAYRNYLSSGADVRTQAGIDGLMRVAPKQAQALQKQMLDSTKTQGEIAKTQGETQKSAWELKQSQTQKHLQELIGVNDVSTAHQWLDAAAASGELKPDVVAATKAKLAQDPSQLNAWKMQAVNGGMTIMQQQEATKPKPEWQDFGGRRAMIDMNPNSPTFRQELMSGDKTVSPDAALSANTQVRGQDMAARTQARGQDMTAATAATGHEITRQHNQAVQGQGKALTEGQSKALLFGTRAQEADKLMNGIASEDGGADKPGLLKRTAEAIPFVGGALGAMVNGTQSDKQQQVEQAQRDFVNAVLRRESGAAISDGEFLNAKKQYFPQIGDSQAVIEQKARNRQLAHTGILAEVPEAQRGSITPNKGGGASGSWAPEKTFDVGGKSVGAKRAPDGKYYVPKPGGGWLQVQE